MGYPYLPGGVGRVGVGLHVSTKITLLTELKKGREIIVCLFNRLDVEEAKMWALWT